jgi:translation initiation factor 3 subunit C
MAAREAPTPATRRVQGGPVNGTEEPEDFTTVGKGGRAMQFTPESIFKNLQAVQEARGKKVTLFS